MDSDLLADLYRRGDAADADKSSSWIGLGARFATKVIPRLTGELPFEAVPEELRAHARASVARGLPLCESPIERALLPWLVCQPYPFFTHMPSLLLPGESSRYQPRTVAVIPQLKIGKFRVDFALAASRGGPIRFVIVECDGRDFHDGPVAIVNDVDRDVAILAHPRVLEVVRLSGREIYRDAAKSAARAAIVVKDSWSVTNRALDAKFGRRR